VFFAGDNRPSRTSLGYDRPGICFDRFYPMEKIDHVQDFTRPSQPPSPSRRCLPGSAYAADALKEIHIDWAT